MSIGTTFEGRDIEAAVKKAAKAEGVAPDELEYEVLAGQQGGFALIRVNSSAKPEVANFVEKLSGNDVDAAEASEEGEPEQSADAPSGEDRRGDRRDRGPRDRDRGRGRGGRGRGRGRDRDRGRGGRGRRSDPRRGGGRSRGPRDIELPPIPEDGPTEVEIVVEGGDLSDIGEDAHEVMRDILIGMGFGARVDMVEDAESLRFDIVTEVYHEVLVASEMRVLDAIEHLIDKIVNFDAGERKRIVVDTNGVKKKADLDLGESARQMAAMAIEQDKIIKLGPLDARSRRIVHLELREMEGVTTRSEGEGIFRRVCIIPKR